MDNQLHFAVRSSDGVSVYDVAAYSTGSGVRLACSCEAGRNDTLCKHRRLLAEGDGSLLDRPDAPGISALFTLLAPTKIPGALAKLRDLEAQAERLKREISAQKHEVSRHMRG